MFLKATKNVVLVQINNDQHFWLAEEPLNDAHKVLLGDTIATFDVQGGGDDLGIIVEYQEEDNKWTESWGHCVSTRGRALGQK